MRIAPIAALFAAALASAATAEDVAEGREIYMTWCATCHGAEGAGGGPMAPILTLVPTDLTALERRAEGAFPTARVVFRIDGRDPLVAHGSPMPVYGDFFEGEVATLRTAAGQPIVTSAPIADLVAYLRTIQD